MKYLHKNGSVFLFYICILFMMLFSLITVPYAANSVGEISDISGHWATAEINKWISLGIAKGNPNGTFRPNDPVTRAEFVTFVNRVFNFKDKASHIFKDVKDNAWYADEIAKAFKAGILIGDGSGYANPDSFITRQEAAVILARVFNLKANNKNTANSFVDSGEIASWAWDAVSALAEKGFILGRPGNKFAPLDNCTRAESIKMIDNIMGLLINKAGTYSNSVEGNLVVNTAGVNLKDMVISGDLYLTEGIGDGNVELDGVTVKGRTFIKGGGEKGGGENSVIIKNSSLEGTVVVLKQDGKVRIVAMGKTEIEKLQLISGAILQEKDLAGEGFRSIEILEITSEGQEIILEGDYEDIIVESPGVSINVINGTVGNLTISKEADGTSVTINENAAVANLVTDAGVTIIGGENIKNAKINAAGVSIDKEPENMTVAEGLIVDVKEEAQEEEIEGEEEAIPPTTSGGGSSSGGSVSIPVSSISLDKKELTLTVGETRKLTATVSPSNATNKKVNWSSDNEKVATVDQNGNVTAVTVGTATITATSTANSSKQDSCVVAVIADVGPVEALISSLPEVPTGEAPELPDLSKPKPDGEKLTAIYNYLAYLENAEAVAAAQEAFDALDPSDQAKVELGTKAKLDAAVAKISELKAFVIDNTTIGVGTYKEDYSGLTEGAKGRIMVSVQWPFRVADGFNTEEGLTSIEEYLYNNEREEIVRNVAVLDKMNPSKTGNWPCNLSGSFDLGVQRVSSSGSWENGLYKLTGGEVTKADLPSAFF